MPPQSPRTLCGLSLCLILLAAGCSKPPLTVAQKKAAAKVQADKCAQAMAHGDMDTILEFTYPKILQMGGGKERLATRVKDEFDNMKSAGISFRSVTVADVTQLVTADSVDYAILPETLELSMPGGTATNDSYLLGISSDGGRSWKFADGAGLATPAARKSILPDLPSALVFPQITRPVPHQAAPTLPGAKPAAKPSRITIERADYKVSVPQGSTVDDENPRIDIDHYTLVNLPEGGTLIFAVLDDKALAEATWDDMGARYKKTLKEPTQRDSDLFDSRKGKGTVIEGKLNGIKFCFEVGTFAGKTKAFIVVCSYNSSARAETRNLLRQVIDSFVIKE